MLAMTWVCFFVYIYCLLFYIYTVCNISTVAIKHFLRLGRLLPLTGQCRYNKDIQRWPRWLYNTTHTFISIWICFEKCGCGGPEACIHVSVENLNDTSGLTFSRSCTTRISARGRRLPHISAERCVPARFRGFLSRGWLEQLKNIRR